MAFSRNGLTKVGSGTNEAPSVWSYTSEDPIGTVNTSGYFNDASGELKVRDLMFITDSATPTASIVIVLSNTGGVVDVSDGLTIPETNTD